MSAFADRGRRSIPTWPWSSWAATAGGPSGFAAAVEASPARDRGSCGPGYLDDRPWPPSSGGASVLAYPSLYEGFGFPPLQAMAAGVPVVATAAGAIPEVVGDGALLVGPADADALAAALSQVLAGGSEIDESGGPGPHRSAEFSWDGCAPGPGRPLPRRTSRPHRDRARGPGPIPATGPTGTPAAASRCRAM